jgi:energy-coupling factor transport system ATP-binding protein
MENITKAAVIENEDIQTAITFKNVKYSYSDQASPAVNGISFLVKRGEFLSILGHNGSGKSTLARLICGLLDADEGEINVWGLNVGEKENVFEVRKHAGIIFQNPDNQMVASIVEDDIAFGPENLGVPRDEIGKRIEWSLAAVGMEKYRHSTPTRLSGGQKQRIAVAGVLAIKPDILILDEATAMLDPKGRKEVIDVVTRLNKEEGMTIILITHFMEEALLADRAIVMNKGEIVLQGTPEDIFESGEQLETYNLCLPSITLICNRLNGADIAVKPCLRPEELASQLAAIARERGLVGKNSDACFCVDNNRPATNCQAKTAGEWDIDIKDLTFTYSKKSPFATHALNGIDLHISEGEFFGIIGHTGSGKSTLVQHLNALIKLPQADKKYKAKKPKKGVTPPTMPQITIGKYNLADKKCDFLSLRASVGMVFQYPEYQLFAESVFDDVAFGLKNFNKNLEKEEIEKAVRESIEIVGLNYNEVKDKSPFDLSGGQKRRVAIAGVIVTKPHILILDEPAAGLDPLGKKEIMELLHKLHREWCKTVIIVSHDMDEIAENCTRACVLSDGKVVMCDTPQNLFKRYKELLPLGLDVPLTAKITLSLQESGVDIDSDFTVKNFTSAVINYFDGGKKQC